MYMVAPHWVLSHFFPTCKTWKSEKNTVPAGEQSPLRNASSAWPGRSGAPQRWLAWCSAWLQAPGALPENKNTDQREATTEKDTAHTQIYTHSHIGKASHKTADAHTSKVKSQMTSQKQSQTGISVQAHTYTHSQCRHHHHEGCRKKGRQREREQNRPWVFNLLAKLLHVHHMSQSLCVCARVC